MLHHWLYLNWEGQVDAFGGDVQLYQKLVFQPRQLCRAVDDAVVLDVLLRTYCMFSFPTSIGTREDCWDDVSHVMPLLLLVGD